MFKFFKELFKKIHNETIIPIAKKKCLYLMVGAPGSGKTTWLKKNAIAASDIVISRDEIRNRLQINNEKKVYEVWIAEIQHAIDNTEGPRNIYADATHLTQGSRIKLLSHLDLTNVDCITALVIRATLVETLRRNDLRTGAAKVDRRIVRRMYNSFERPEKDTAFPLKVRYLEVPK